MEENIPQTPQTPIDPELERLRTYLAALQDKKMELMTGAQSYAVGTRSLARYNISIKEINAEIARTQLQIDRLVGKKNHRLKPMVFVDT